MIILENIRNFKTIEKMTKIHPLSDVQSGNIGLNTMIWQFCVILKNAKIGDNCNINCHVFIENDVKIGNSVTIKPGVQVWDGITLEDNVFVGPNVTFTNDHFPKSQNTDFILQKTLVKRGCSIGANATILSGLTLGENALIGAGSVVTSDIPANEIWVGNPAKFLKNNHD